MGRAQFKRTSQHTHKVIPADLCPPLTVQFITDGACFCLCCGLGDLCVVAVSCHEAIHCVSTRQLEIFFGLETSPGHILADFPPQCTAGQMSNTLDMRDTSF